MAKRRPRPADQPTLPMASPPAAAVEPPAPPAGPPPEGYAYVFIRREGPRAIIQWRMKDARAVEQQHQLKTDASEWTPEQMRDKAASYLGIPDDQAERVQLGQH